MPGRQRWGAGGTEGRSAQAVAQGRSHTLQPRNELPAWHPARGQRIGCSAHVSRGCHKWPPGWRHCPLVCSLGGPVVVRKGGADAAGDGQQVLVCDEEGSPRRAGGQVRGWAPSCSWGSRGSGQAAERCPTLSGAAPGTVCLCWHPAGRPMLLVLAALPGLHPPPGRHPCCMQGDVLSGCIATFAAWAQRAGGASREQLHEQGDGGGAAGIPPLLLAAYAGCVTTRWVLARRTPQAWCSHHVQKGGDQRCTLPRPPSHIAAQCRRLPLPPPPVQPPCARSPRRASRRAFARQRRSMGATDLLAELGAVADELAGAGGT